MHYLLHIQYNKLKEDNHAPSQPIRHGNRAGDYNIQKCLRLICISFDCE